MAQLLRLLAQNVLPLTFFLEFFMRTLFSYAVLLATSFAVFAGPNDPVSLPEPGVFALIGVGIAALLISRRTKK